MRLHMLDYAREHQEELAEELKSQLSVRRITIQQYIVMMECGATSGSEIALLIMARMFKISIGVVRGDFMWLSEKIECKRCDVVIVQNCDGHFVGTKRLDGRVVNIGTVPKYQVNRRRTSESISTSTPKTRYCTQSAIAEPTVSPIVDEGEINRNDESGFDSSKIFNGKCDVQMTCQTTEGNQQERVIENSSKQKIVTLNIRDIGNETSKDYSASGIEKDVGDIITPGSSSAINITSPESAFEAMSKSMVESCGNGSFSTAYEGKTQSTIKDDSDVNADDEASRSNVQFSDFMNSPVDGFVPGEKDNLSASNGHGNTFDPDETIDDGELSVKSEITDDTGKGTDEKSEVSDISKSIKRKRLGSTGPVITVTDGGKTSKMRRSEEKEEDVIYREITVVKLGCNKCTEIYYSDGAYNQHLFQKHRIRNASRHPPTVINKIWTRIPDKPLIGNFPHQCDICKAKFLELANLIKHKETCKPRTVEDEEDRQSRLYQMVQEYEEDKRKEEEEKSKNSEERNVIDPTQRRTQRRSRSLKRNWTKRKQTSRKSSDDKGAAAPRYVKKPIDKSKLNESDEKKDNVEYYQEASDSKQEEEEDQTSSSTVPSADSRHATDTDFKISSNVNSTSQSSTEDSMPVIEMPKIKYQLRSLKKFKDMKEQQKFINEEEEKEQNTSANQKEEEEEEKKKREIQLYQLKMMIRNPGKVMQIYQILCALIRKVLVVSQKFLSWMIKLPKLVYQNFKLSTFLWRDPESGGEMLKGI